VTDVSAWLARPAGEHGFIRVRDGRFAAPTARGGFEPIRFWGANLCARDCFPDRERAESTARSLARFGFNVVRLHHMDGRAMWGDRPDKLTIDPAQLDRLDYFVDQLKRRGIYVNVNLHVSRWLGDAEGFPGRDRRPKYDKGLGHFEPRMMDLQQRFARDLLTHVNPHTGTAYAAEPAVAFVEISNEDGLLDEWFHGNLDGLPDPYAATFRQLWNAWLRRKYGSLDRLRAAWGPEGQAAPREDRLEADAVPILRHADAGVAAPARADFIDFLWDTEREYWTRMRRFLKEDLKVRSLIAGTQVGFSPVPIQAELDYVDAHAYWHHPAFPGKPWDPENWTIVDEALASHWPGTLGQLAARRVLGKPHTVSEYDHPIPNAYRAEGYPLIAAFGAFQGWDAVYTFSFVGTDAGRSRSMKGFFDVFADPAKLAHLPACAALFARGDAAPARRGLRVAAPPEAARRLARKTGNPWTLSATGFGLDPTWCLLHAVALDLGAPSAAEPPAPGPAPRASDRRIASDTGEIRWEPAPDGAVLIDTPRTKVFTGFVRGRVFELGNVRLAIGPTRLDWATVSMVCLDGRGFDATGRLLIAATGWTQNTGWELRRLADRKVTLGAAWGRSPVLCEGVTADVRLPVAADRVRWYPLDGSGRRRDAAPVQDRDGSALLALDPRHRTVWYEVEVR
jgi:hypothetical protein